MGIIDISDGIKQRIHIQDLLEAINPVSKIAQNRRRLEVMSITHLAQKQ
jgi:hypothetical protein